jgi:hypothetical protein
VSDETLRDLERRVKASPTDVALGHELLRALERGGESARATEELVRIARLGDAEARERLERLSAPRPTRHKMGHRRGVASPASGRWSSMRHMGGRFGHLHGASDRMLHTTRQRSHAAYDLRTLAELWTRDTLIGSTAVGSATSFHAVEGGLAVLGEGGERLRFSEVGFYTHAADALGDRALAIATSPSESRVVCVEGGTGSVLWSESVGKGVPDVALVPGRVFVGGNPATTPGRYFHRILDETTGATLWTDQGPGKLHVLAADAFGFACHHAQRVALLDRSGGSPAELEGTERAVAAHMDREHVVVSRAEGLQLHDRASRERLWSSPLVVSSSNHLALAGEHVWTARVFLPSGFEVSALARADGHEVASWRHAWEVDMFTSVHLVPLDGALVVLATNERDLLLLRLEEG